MKACSHFLGRSKQRYQTLRLAEMFDTFHNGGMRPIFWFGVLAAIFGLIAGYQLLMFGTFDSSIINAPPESEVTLAGAKLDVYVADTPEERQLGLGGRDYLPPDQGMLFIFPEDGTHSFWMKDMRFPVDILWFSSDGRIVTIVSNVSPDTYPDKIFGPKEPARYVLEVNAGFVAQNGVEIGDGMNFK